MRSRTRWLLGTVAVICYLPVCFAQDIRLNAAIFDSEGGYFYRWDSVQDKLIMYRDLNLSQAPAAQIIRGDGMNIPVSPLKDLPESLWIDVWSAAATPEGGIVLGAIVGYEPRTVKIPKVRRLLLTYDKTGELEKVWDIKPRHAFWLAVDSSGSVFGLGDNDAPVPFQLITKYSPTGRVVREFLSTDALADWYGMTSYGAERGDPDMFINGDQLFVWLGPAQELLRFSLAGDLIARTSLADALNRLAGSGTDHTRVRLLRANAQGEAIAHVQLWPKKKGDPVTSVIVRVGADHSSASVLSAPPAWAEFLGTTKQGKLVFLHHDRGGPVVRMY